MKANEAPEKLYLHPTAKGDVGASWLTFPLTNEDVEYVRTDAFIEEVSAWIKKMFSETDCRFEQDYTGMLINDFKETIKQ